MKIPLVAATVMASLVLGFGNPSAAAPGDSNSVSRIEGLVRQIQLVLKKHRQPVRIDFHSDRCDPEGDQGWNYQEVLLPDTKVNAPDSDESALASIRSLLRGNPSVIVSQDGSGLIRIRIGKVSDTLLSTKIRKIHLSPDVQFNEVLAIGAIEDTPEVKAAILQLKRQSNVVPFFGSVQPPEEGLPRLPSRLTNITYGEFLDLTAKTFDNIVTHGECDIPGRIDTEAFSRYDTGMSWIGGR